MEEAEVQLRFDATRLCPQRTFDVGAAQRQYFAKKLSRRNCTSRRFCQRVPAQSSVRNRQIQFQSLKSYRSHALDVLARDEHGNRQVPPQHEETRQVGVPADRLLIGNYIVEHDERRHTFVLDAKLFHQSLLTLHEPIQNVLSKPCAKKNGGSGGDFDEGYARDDLGATKARCATRRARE